MRFTDASLARLPRWLAVTPLIIIAMVTPFTALGAGTNGLSNDPASVALEVAPIGSPVLNVAVKALGTYEGECFPWVRRVVHAATGRQMGFGYRTGYLEAGAVEVPLESAKPGDILQLIDDRDDGASADYSGMHTAIVLGVQSPGVFRVIDSNLAFDGVVRVRDDYNPVALASRFPNISVHVYRFYEPQTASGSDVGFRGSFSTISQPGMTGPQPIPGTAPAIASALGGTLVPGGSEPLQAGAAATIRADGDCLRLRSAASSSAPVLTCLADGGSVTLLQGSVQADGIVWQSVSANGVVGWVASQYLVRSGNASSAPTATATAAPAAQVAPTATATPAPVVAAGPSSPAAGGTEGTSPAIIGDLPSGGGLALVVFSGGSTDSLLSTINQRRCSPVSVWASKSGGGLIGLIPGAPPMVNRDWQAQFPSNTLEPRSPLIVVCGGAASTNAVSTSPAPAVSAAPGTRGSATPPGPAGNE